MLSSFAIVRISVYTAIANYAIRIFNAFGVGVACIQLAISFLLGWHRGSSFVDRRYRPFCPVGGTELTIDIDREQPTGRLKPTDRTDDTCGLEMMVSTILVSGCAIFLRGVAQYYMCCVLQDFDKLLRYM